MIFVTGDTHCPIDIHKLREKKFPSHGLTRSDFVIICGDAGLVWYGTDKEDSYWQDWLDKKPWTTLFVDGNHENHSKLDEMPVSEWHGGNVHFLRPNVIHLMRGQVYDICGKKFFAMGGAESEDKKYREENVSWWAREMPSDEEYETALDNLKKCGGRVDYIITHCCPTSIQAAFFSRKSPNRLTDFLDEVMDKTKFKAWFFGHYHENIAVSDRLECLYNNIKRIE